MKTTIKNYRTMSIALFIALAISTVTMANDEKKNKSVATVEFKYIGQMEKQPVFELNLQNAEGEEFIISFRDDYGTVLYSNIVRSSLTQKFLINTEEVGDNTLTVEVRSRKTNKSEKFTINRNQTLVYETVVARNN